ncbi:MAG: hypothetical protein K6F37_06025 [Lachnospiraceae bacterium]|nr:hypothetical protein [Lachnospiraceae bacterium]
MREMRSMLKPLELFGVCFIVSALMAVGTVGVVLVFSGISVDTLGIVAFSRFSVVATVIFFAIFMSNVLDRRK